MVKTLVSMVIAVGILIGGAIFENAYIRHEFGIINTALISLYEKVEEKSATEDDVYAVQNCWLDKKKNLHVFLPHNDLKEVDLWIAESVKLIKNKKWEDALSKIEVLIELSEQIPKTFVLLPENVL